MGRITLEILQPVPLAPLSVSVELVRPGRSVELLEASLSGPDGELIRAGLARAGERPAARRAGAAAPRPDAGAEGEFFATGQEVGYHTAMEYRFVKGGFVLPGPATVWMRPRVPLVSVRRRRRCSAPSSQPIPATESALRSTGGRPIFINTDLTVHLLREPVGEWVCLDAVTHVDGLGMADSALYDERGRIGAPSRRCSSGRLSRSRSAAISAPSAGRSAAPRLVAANSLRPSPPPAIGRSASEPSSAGPPSEGTMATARPARARSSSVPRSVTR